MKNQPMPLAQVIARIINPALAELPVAMDSPKARVQLLTIGQQESTFADRYQVLDDPTKKGPARGLWQFERGGGVKGVMEHPQSTGHAHRACAAHGVAWDRTAVWTALEHDDILACIFARLLLYTDPYPLPAIDDADAAWDLYAERTWKPGKPHRDKWDGYHRAARAALGLA